MERRPKTLLIVRGIIEYLSAQPGNMATYEDIRAHMGLSKETKKLFKMQEMVRFVKGDVRVPYRAMYPQATEAQWRRKGTNVEKHVRVAMLIKNTTR